MTDNDGCRKSINVFDFFLNLERRAENFMIFFFFFFSKVRITLKFRMHGRKIIKEVFYLSGEKLRAKGGVRVRRVDQGVLRRRQERRG